MNHYAVPPLLTIFAALAFACAGDARPVAVSPTPAREAIIVSHGDPTRRAAALTFDVDSATDPGHTAEILRILRQNNVRATFSLTGRWAEQNRDLLFSIAADGHQIMNGTYDGRSFLGPPPLTTAERRRALFRTETTVYRYTSRTTKPYTRPPDGDIDATAATDVAAEGYTTIVLWTVDSLAGQMIENARPGAIYRLHTSRAEDAAALPELIRGLRDQTYALETIDDLLHPKNASDR